MSRTLCPLHFPHDRDILFPLPPHCVHLYVSCEMKDEEDSYSLHLDVCHHTREDLMALYNHTLAVTRSTLMYISI